MSENDTRRYNYMGKDVSGAREQINGNWYYILTWEEPKVYSDKYLCIVLGYFDGSKMDHIKPGNLSRSDLETFVRNEEEGWKDIEISEFVSKTVNEAVSKVENKQEDRQSLEDDIVSALEANKEVHEGIDHELNNDV